MLTEQTVKKELVNYINEELSNDDMREIRHLIRVEVAEIFFDLFKKRSIWIK